MRRHEPASRWCAEAELRVQFFDLDPMEIVWHGRYVQYLEVVRCVLLDQIGYNYVQMKASGYAWPVIDLHLRYVAPATFGQRLKLRADIVEWENRLKIEYLITDAASGNRIRKAIPQREKDRGGVLHGHPRENIENLDERLFYHKIALIQQPGLM